MQPEVRHNRDKQGGLSPLSSGIPDPLSQPRTPSHSGGPVRTARNQRRRHVPSVTRSADDVHLAGGGPAAARRGPILTQFDPPGAGMPRPASLDRPKARPTDHRIGPRPVCRTVVELR